jgi:muramoyltetrapeptide carboxypeptidase
MLKPNKLKVGDMVGVVAPSRPIIRIKREIGEGIKIVESLGFKVKLGKNLNKKLYYSAGSAQERASDLNSMFANRKVKAIICATGGLSSSQILDLIDYDLIKKNPKIFIGYSDTTALLLAIHKKTNLITFHGTDLCDLESISKNARTFLFDMIMGKKQEYILPNVIEVIRHGNAIGELVGGNLYLTNSLLGTKYSPSYAKKIWFWEDTGESPASLDQKLTHLKLTGKLEKISAMVIGNLSDCKDKKYKEDNRPIKDIVLELTKNYNFPIIKVSYFGHDIANFYTLPIGAKAIINTKINEFKIIESPVLK